MKQPSASFWRSEAINAGDVQLRLVSPSLKVNQDTLVKILDQGMSQKITHRRTTLISEEPALFALWLFFLSGRAHQVLLLPGDLDTEQKKASFNQADSELIITQEEYFGRQNCIQSSLILGLEPTTKTEIDVDTVWLLTTSGTTGKPKIVRHTSRSLSATVQRDPVRGSDLYWGLLYDPARFAGLQVVLQAILGGSTLVVGDSTQTFEDRLRFFADAGVNALSATPTLWRKMLMFGLLDSLDLRQITLGGEIADQQLLDTLAMRFPNARISHVYASTEAGVGFSVKDGREGFPASWLTEPPLGIEIAVNADGELMVRSNHMGLGYLSGASWKDTGQWIATGDIVEIRDARVYFRGRRSGIINVGGDKVHPELVEQVLLEHPGVASALVRARKSSVTGALVEAIVVPIYSDVRTDELRKSVIEHCRSRLPRYAVPALVQVTHDLATTTAGKIERR